MTLVPIKFLLPRGFLLSDDWMGRQFEDKKEIVIFDGSAQDLKEKIDYYLKHEDERRSIAKAGYEAGKKYTRYNWAEMILTPIVKQNPESFHDCFINLAK